MSSATPSSLLADLANPPVARLSFLGWVESQPKDLQDALQKAAVDHRWTTSALEQLLRTKHGVKCSSDSIAQWRRSLGYVPRG